MITFKNLSKDIPYVLFKDKYERAESANQQNVEAMCISSYSKTLEEVNARFVNLKFVEDRHFNLRHFDEIKMHPSDVRMMTSLAQDAVRKYETEEEKA